MRNDRPFSTFKTLMDIIECDLIDSWKMRNNDDPRAVRACDVDVGGFYFTFYFDANERIINCVGTKYWGGN